MIGVGWGRPGTKYPEVDRVAENARLTKKELRQASEDFEKLSICDIAEQVGKIYHVPMIHLLGDRRQRCIARPRMIAMYLAYKHTGASLPVIGRFFGNRDHTTVLHAHRTISKLVEQGKLELPQLA